MNKNSQFLQRFSALFRAEPRSMPSFLNERVLRDIGILEPEAPARKPAESGAYAQPAIKHHIFSIGLNGL